MTPFDAPPPRSPPGEAAPGGAGAGARRARVRLLVAYDGGGFHGFAPQPGVATVGGALAGALGRVLRCPAIELTCAGRTDTGVHARGQVVSFDAPADALPGGGPTGTPLDQLRHAVNRICAPAIVVRGAEVVDASFDARFSATWRRYRYTVVNRPEPDPFLARYAWHVAAPLDRRAMDQACIPFVGEHDFASFCRRPRPGRGAGAGGELSLVRRVRSMGWEDTGEGVLHLWVEAGAFCHQMVRSVVGTLVDVGRGRRRAGDILAIIAAGDRHAAGEPAPPQGLCLWAVGYPPEP